MTGPGAASVRGLGVAARDPHAHRTASACAVHRHRDRAPQLRRRPGDRSVGRKARSSLAVLLIIGFGVHNATEGFGIVAPLAAENELPSWSFLLVLGVIAGGPTFLGTVIGESFVNETVDMMFLALAAGSILYVIVQLLHVGVKLDREC